ncbi:MAG: hypothetical protein ABR951_07640 [Candidatus Aminicenantales bacterium]|jgi:hypothetical protein
MTKCRHEGLIDSYLLDKLKPEEQTDFEEHYFICRSCFSKMSERDEIIQILRKEGVLNVPLTDLAEDARATSWVRRAWAFLTPRRWVVAGISAVALFIAVWLLHPRTGTIPPPLVLTEDETVRGGAVTPVSPVADVQEAPAFLEWKSAGDDLEYKVSLSGRSPLMTTSTKDTRWVLTNDIKARLKAGVTYSWQVQAFKADGTLTAVSKRIRFRIVPKS